MIKLITTPLGREIMVVDVPQDAISFVIDPAIEFLTYKIPNYKNWVTNDELMDHNKNLKFLERTEGLDAYKLTGIKIPSGNCQLLNRLNDLTDEDCEPFMSCGIDARTMFATVNGEKTFRSAKHTFLCFLRSRNIDTTPNPLIIVKK